MAHHRKLSLPVVLYSLSVLVSKSISHHYDNTQVMHACAIIMQHWSNSAVHNYYGMRWKLRTRGTLETIEIHFFSLYTEVVLFSEVLNVLKLERK